MDAIDNKARARCRRDVVKVSGTVARQRGAWQDAADADGSSLSRWMREAADAAVLTGVTAADLRAELVKLRASLGKGVGNNLAQIGRALNLELTAAIAPGAAPYEAALIQASQDLAAVRRQVEALLRRVQRSGRGRR